MLLTPSQLAQTGAPALDAGTQPVPVASNVTAPSALDSSAPVPFPELGAIMSPMEFNQPATVPNPAAITEAVQAAEGTKKKFFNFFPDMQSLVAVVLGLMLIAAGIFQFKPARQIIVGAATGA